MSDDWVELVRPDGSRDMIKAEDTLNGMKQRIILILHDELYVSGDQSIEGRLESDGSSNQRLGATDMAEIERYDPVMGTRLYLCLTDDERCEWTDRFYSSELPDDEAERLAAEITPRLTSAGFVVEVLY